MNKSTFFTPIEKIIALTAVLMAVGCGGPFSAEHYMELQVPAEKLTQIETLDIEAMSKSPEATDKGDIEQAELAITLEMCRVLVLQNNLDMQVQLMSPTIASETINQERAKFESLIYSNAEYVRTDTPTSTDLDSPQLEHHRFDLGVSVPLRTGGALDFNLPIDRTDTNNTFSTLNPAHNTDASFSISQPLLRGAGPRTNTHSIRLAIYEGQIANLQTKMAIIGLLQEAEATYWHLYAVRRALEVRKQEYDLAVAQLEKAERMVSAGTAAEVEIIRAESGVAERLEGIIIAENSLRNQQRFLKRLINKPGLGLQTATILIPRTEPEPVHYNLDAEKLTNSALDGRMEMLELAIRLAQDADTIQYERNMLLPLVSAGYRYNVNGLGSSYGDSFDLLGEKRFEDNMLSLRAELPLGNARAKSKLREAIYTRHQRLLSTDAKQLLIVQEVYESIDGLEAAWQRILASRQSAILAGRNLTAEQRQFELGLSTSTDVLDAQTRLLTEQLREIEALAEYQIAQVNLAVATGTVLGAANITIVPIVPDTD